jgi:hypothetical protein
VHLVSTRPRCILDNASPEVLPALPDGKMASRTSAGSLWKRLFANG